MTDKDMLDSKLIVESHITKKGPGNIAKVLFFLVGREGIEPSTY